LWLYHECQEAIQQAIQQANILKISNNDLKKFMIIYLTFQDLSINIWEMINFLWHSRNVSLLGKRSALTAMHIRT
jgi:hypothetical protein